MPSNGCNSIPLSKREHSLEDGANIFSTWTLWYLGPLLALGSSKVLESEDCGVPSKEDLAKPAYLNAKSHWQQEIGKAAAWNAANPTAVKKKEPSLSRALMVAYGRGKIYVAMVYYLLGALLQFVPVLLLEDLVKLFEAGGTVADYPNGYANPWIEVVCLFLAPFLISLLQTRHQTIMTHCSVFVRTATSTLLYEKSLTVSASGRASTSTGQVVNMMSNDTNQLQRFLLFIGMTTLAPIQIILSLVLIFRQVGNATWVGVGFMVFLVPINILIFRVVGTYRRTTLKFSDLRVKMMNEIVAGIRILKFYGWERPYGEQVEKLRAEEMHALTKLAYTSAIGFSMILLSAPIIQPILVFLTYVNIQDTPLSAATAFTTVALFNIMRFPFAFMPMGLLQYVQSKISIRRLENYLKLPELQPYVLNEADPKIQKFGGGGEGSVTMNDCSFTWIDQTALDLANSKSTQNNAESTMNKKKKKNNKKNTSNPNPNASDDKSAASDTDSAEHMKRVESYNSLSGMTENAEDDGVAKITLRNISCHIPAGSLVAVVGSVGSGKSSFLSAILGEMEALEGSQIYVPKGSSGDDNNGDFMSYCTQVR